MMVKVKSIGAIIDGRPVGSIFELEERTAERLAKMGYVRVLEKPAPVKKESSAPKKPATKAKSRAKTKTAKKKED